MKAFTAYIPTRLLFGAGKLKELHLQKMPGKRALLVLSCGKSAKESGTLKQTEEEFAEVLESGGATIAFTLKG